MPFITNDFNNMLVDDVDYEKHSEKYKYYVIARRLFVSSKVPFSFEYLRERFKKYGTIESAKMLESNKEGFVTFECDRHACLAYNLEKDKCEEKIVRVDSTWHQPDVGVSFYSEWNTIDEDDWSEPDESMDEPIDPNAPSPLLSLDDYCLFTLFDHCCNMTLVNLSMTCSRLKQLLKGGDYYFANRKTFSYESENANLSLVDAANIFRLMGRYFVELDVWFDNMESTEKIFGFIRIIVKYCRVEKVQKMTFGMCGWKNEIFTQLGPILKNLTSLSLSIDDYNDEDIAVDFTEMCPNMKTLILWDIFIVEKCLTKTTTSLESFYWKYSWDELVGELQSFKFFEMNRQLKLFECIDFNFEELELTTHLLPNVENLTLYVSGYYRLSTNDVLNLKNFKNLKKLTLGLVENEIDKAEVIEYCGRLKHLLELKLYFGKPAEHNQVIDFSTKLAHLERLDLYCVPSNEKVVIDFVRVAKKIKTIHFHECNVYATESFLAQLGAMAISSQRQRYKDGVSLFIGNNLRNNFVAINDEKVSSIGWICNHRFRRHD